VDPRATVRLEGSRQRKIPKTPSGIEPATFRLAEQYLNQLQHRVPPSISAQNIKIHILKYIIKLEKNETNSKC
jgi:hypothetical protein